MKDLQTTNNICYYNYRKKYINKYVFDKLVFKNKFNACQISIYTEEKRKKEMAFYLRKLILLNMKISYIILVWF